MADLDLQGLLAMMDATASLVATDCQECRVRKAEMVWMGRTVWTVFRSRI
jgi:hypothetical protein